MTQLMRDMISELMGSSASDTNKPTVPYYDPTVCRAFLLDCCPYDILASTRFDLGDCYRKHDLALRADFDAANKKKNLGYEFDALDTIQQTVNDCDHRIEACKKKLSETQEDMTEEATGLVEQMHDLGEQIGTKLASAESLGEDGKVEESLKLMDEVELLKKQRADIEGQYRQMNPSTTYQQQKLRVCEICSAYLGIHDNDRRLADHFGGKLHLGFIRIRDELRELSQHCAGRQREQPPLISPRDRDNDRRDDRPRPDRNDRPDRSSDRDRDRERRRSRSPRRSSSGSSSRHRRSRSRDRERKRRD